MNILRAKRLLPPDQSRMREQAKFTYSPLGKAFEKQKAIEDAAEKQRNTTEDAAEKQTKFYKL